MERTTGGRAMRWVVVAFYAALVSFVSLAGGVVTGAHVLAAAAALIIMLRPVDAGRAIAEWSDWFFNRKRVTSSS